MSRSAELRQLPPLVRFALLAGGMAAYAGLAALGLGGFAPFFSTPALTALLAVTAALFAAAYFAGGNLSSGEREDRSNRWVIPAFGLISIALAYAPAYCDRANIWTIDGDAVRWIGVALFALGGALRLWPVFVLGHRFSGLVAIQTGHRLVTSGVYRVIRHPSYLGLLVSSVGWALAFRSGVGLALAALLLAPTVARIRAEERLLAQAFGAEYEAYRARTRSKLLPGIY
jgi:protein-S-isoprenylcysteine O-methyltransferase Ste14